MLEQFIEANSLEAEILTLGKQAATIRGAAKALGAKMGDFAKAEVFVYRDKGVLVIAGIKESVSKENACEGLGIEGLRCASMGEAEEITGFKEGCIPPIGIYGVRTIMDKNLMKKDVLYFSLGENRFLKITPKEIEENSEEFEAVDLNLRKD